MHDELGGGGGGGGGGVSTNSSGRCEFELILLKEAGVSSRWKRSTTAGRIASPPGHHQSPTPQTHSTNPTTFGYINKICTFFH